MNRKQMAGLVEIAQLLKERNLSELSQIAARRAALVKRQAALHDQRAASRQLVAQTPELGAVQAPFESWLHRAETRLREDLVAVDTELEAQKQKAAMAFGRHGNLSKMEHRLVTELGKRLNSAG